ncbi:hypothetical protein M758_1G148500 [Ceratodon purpureus]|uniref:Uncharacterized protein n=1 Tax=Ceratodon purpureus TaxID=3225 RepID=A0A8T0J7C2_CERPU|nr:hypothetical protein KC19_1G151400 [Ceratodon purpureus]KAG0630024.1 hypothetical protein M758_1G148500 [Ceratodon purpureus]
MAAMEGRCVHSSTGTPPLRPGRCWRSPFAGDWLPWNRALGLWSYVMEYSFLPPLGIEFLVVNRNGIHAQGESNSCGT